MYVLHAWQSSLQLFKPANLKLFGLVVLKSIKSTYEKYIKYGWPFLAMAILGTIAIRYYQENVLMLVYSHGIGDNPGQFLFWFTFSLMLLLFISYCTFLVALFARTSVDKKDGAYIKKYTKNYFIWYLLFHAFYAIFSGSLCICIFNCCAQLCSPSFLFPFALMVKMFFYVAHIFSILFLLDLGRGLKNLIKAIWFGIKMAFYNMPFTLIVSVVLCYIDVIIRVWSISALLYPLWFCVIACYYIKKVHDQSRLYQGL